MLVGSADGVCNFVTPVYKTLKQNRQQDCYFTAKMGAITAVISSSVLPFAGALLCFFYHHQLKPWTSHSTALFDKGGECVPGEYHLHLSLRWLILKCSKCFPIICLPVLRRLICLATYFCVSWLTCSTHTLHVLAGMCARLLVGHKTQTKRDPVIKSGSTSGQKLHLYVSR